MTLSLPWAHVLFGMAGEQGWIPASIVLAILQNGGIIPALVLSSILASLGWKDLS